VSRYIQKIEVEKLFGHYNYTIEKNTSNLTVDPLIIIYGDNGSGKTTLLELIFYLTSSVDNKGHKSKIAKYKFQKLSILFDGGIEIIAKRKKGEIIGSYSFAIKENGIKIKETFLQAKSDLNISIADEDPSVIKKYYDILKYIESLNLSIHYLSDNRKLLSNVDNFSNKNSRKNSYIRTQIDFEFMRREGFINEEADDLKSSVKALENWIKKHVLQASKAGDKNTNTIYTDIIKRVSSHSNNIIKKQEVADLVQKLTDIRKENMSYYKNGLVSKIETKEIEQTLEDPTKYNSNLIYNVLEPYVEGLRGRLDSLRDIQGIIELFIKNINGYFANKVITYHLVDGFNIVGKDIEEPIETEMLSSGEKQLLLLFCNVITASDNASIFIIDEPEISLNIKWQRKLIQTLLDFSQNKNVQFVFASHSIELLAGHKDSVVKLTHNKDNSNGI
jgi:energy-coupling factor transporter ATP-binding protein EcfA2